MSEHFENIFSVFWAYPKVAPKNLKEVEKLEEECRKSGREGLADDLMAWRTNMQYRMEAEFTEPTPKDEHEVDIHDFAPYPDCVQYDCPLHPYVL